MSGSSCSIPECPERRLLLPEKFVHLPDCFLPILDVTGTKSVSGVNRTKFPVISWLFTANSPLAPACFGVEETPVQQDSELCGA
ncbi:hypothetical protein llap_4555 [Limosa lapponica baueri]|uniref:Uncharacterized protein n=1 Tax=Limosa lapponica baueri TaxID=1758121 RepID=A0A2I0UGH9_LIMLA|nr:hypothetical protein llap_4555 [Limosa lapponica baueri]